MRLPTIREMAASWGIGPRTVQLAVSEAVREGRLETRQGSGIWPLGARPETAEPPVRMDAMRLSERIRTQIGIGALASGQWLPAPKDCARDHGLHPSTVRKAFGLLEAGGAVQRQGRGWKVSMPEPKGGGNASLLLCIGAGDERGNLRMDSDREWEFWREIQAEAVRCGLEPRLMPWSGRLVVPAGALGAVVSTWHLPDSTPLLDGLMRAGLPAAVWVANHEILPGKRYRQARTLWFHDQAFGKEAGLVMGRHVSGLGHRKIAWISPFHGSTWSQNRLDGLRKGLSAEPGIELFEAVGPWVSEWDVQKDVHLDPQVLGRIDLKGLDCRRELARIATPLVEAVTRGRALESFGPRLEAALASGATLWIAGSDLAALWCLHWLEGKGMRVPEDLSLAAFDDTREATRLGLASLRFDVQGMGRAMLRQILSSRQPHNRLTRYDGAVMVRASLRRAGAAAAAL